MKLKRTQPHVSLPSHHKRISALRIDVRHSVCHVITNATDNL